EAKVLLSTPEEAVELMLSSSSDGIKTLAALILDDTSELMGKHYVAMRRLTNLLSFTKRQTHRGINIVGVAEFINNENVQALSQIFSSDFIIQNMSSADIIKGASCSRVSEKEVNNKHHCNEIKEKLLCLSSRTEEEENYENNSSLSKRSTEINTGEGLQVNKDEALILTSAHSSQTPKHKFSGGNMSTSTSLSEKLTFTTEKSEIVSSTEIITKETHIVIRSMTENKKTFVNTINKPHSLREENDSSSNIVRNYHHDSSSNNTNYQINQNPNNVEGDKCNTSSFEPNKSQEICSFSAKMNSQDCSKSNRTDRSVWRSGTKRADIMKNKEERERIDPFSKNTSSHSENRSPHDKQDYINKNSISFQQDQNDRVNKYLSLWKVRDCSSNITRTDQLSSSFNHTEDQIAPNPIGVKIDKCNKSLLEPNKSQKICSFSTK
ncbi:unnamed protein product, partial [Meganyctiphanes norvegica]